MTNGSQMRAAIEYIDPAYAKQALEQNVDTNRRVSRVTVDRYARMMRAGRWLPTGESVKFTADGRLLDGQHRMHAIIASQQTVALLVVRGVPPESFLVLDTGKPRTIADVLSMSGVKHAHVAATVGRAAYAYASGLAIGASVDIPTQRAFIDAHPRALDVAALVSSRLGKIFPKGPVGTVLLLGNEGGYFDKEQAEFIDALASGAGMFRGHPVLTLREWRLNNSGARTLLTSAALFSATARAWNALVEGRELLKIAKAAANPTRDNTPIVGFNHEKYFPDVPDLREELERKWTSNLPNAKPPLLLPSKL